MKLYFINENERSVSSSNVDFSKTNVYRLRLCGESLNLYGITKPNNKFWAVGYSEFVEKLWNAGYERRLRPYMNQTFLSEGKAKTPDFTSYQQIALNGKTKMRREIAEEYFLNICLSANQIVERISALERICGLDPNDVEIWIESKVRT